MSLSKIIDQPSDSSQQEFYYHANQANYHKSEADKAMVEMSMHLHLMKNHINEMDAINNEVSRG